MIMENTDERMIPEYADHDTYWEHIHRYLFASRFVTDKAVLDIACGEGYGSAILRGMGAKSVVGVDVDQEACNHAAQRYGIETRVGSAEEIPLENNSVDVVVSFETVEHVPNPVNFLREIDRILRPGGTVVISTPDKDLYSPEGKDKNPHHCSELTTLEFMNLLRPRYRKITYFGQRPQSALFCSPVSLISESALFDRFRLGYRIRRKLWEIWSPRRLQSINGSERAFSVSDILALKQSSIERFFDWSTVRPLSALRLWAPVFIVAVAQK